MLQAFHKILGATIACLLLGSCGFHLQGNLQLAPPLHRMYIQSSDPYGYLARSLQQYLKMSHVCLVATAAQADTVLIILQDSNSQKLLSVNSTQQTRQYNLYVTVVFEITDSNGRIIVPPQALSEVRVITIQSNQVLGSSNEANLFYQQMRRSLAGAIMNRIASKDITTMIYKNTPSSKVKTS